MADLEDKLEQCLKLERVVTRSLKAIGPELNLGFIGLSSREFLKPIKMDLASASLIGTKSAVKSSKHAVLPKGLGIDASLLSRGIDVSRATSITKGLPFHSWALKGLPALEPIRAGMPSLLEQLAIKRAADWKGHWPSSNLAKTYIRHTKKLIGLSSRILPTESPELVDEVIPETYRALDLNKAFSGEEYDDSGAEAIAENVRKELIPMLQRANPELVRQYEKAHKYLANRDSDGLCMSLRKLIEHVLHVVAPVERVKQKTECDKVDLSRRLEYLLGNVKDERQRQFFRGDLWDFVPIMRKLNSSVHRLSFAMNAPEMRSLLRRVEAQLRIMLTLGPET